MFGFGVRKLTEDFIQTAHADTVLKVFQKRKLSEDNLYTFYMALDKPELREKYRTDAAIRLFLKLLAMEDSLLRQYAVRILCRIGSIETALDLVRVLEHDKNVWVREAAGEGLAETGWSEVVPLLVKAVALDEWPVSCAIAAALGRRRNPAPARAIAHRLTELAARGLFEDVRYGATGLCPFPRYYQALCAMVTPENLDDLLPLLARLPIQKSRDLSKSMRAVDAAKVDEFWRRAVRGPR